MTQDEILAAANMLVEARKTGVRLDCLPEAIRPTTLAEGHAVQDAVTKILGDVVGVWKVNAPADGRVFRGNVGKSRVFESPARVSARSAGLCGVEAEIAFVFPDGLEGRLTEYTYDEVADVVQAMPAFDLVDTRFENFMDLTVFERIADGLNAGSFIHGSVVTDWRKTDFTKIETLLYVDDEVVVRTQGGHGAGDPLLPLVKFVNVLRADIGVPAGTTVLTGSFTGFEVAKPGQNVRAEFVGFGGVEVKFEA